MEIDRRVVVRRLHARSAVRRVVDDDAGRVPHVVVAEIEGHVGNVGGPKAPGIPWTLRGHTLHRHVRFRRNYDRLVRSQRLCEPLEKRRLQYFRRIEQRTRAPDDEVARHGDRDVVVVEVAVELLYVGEVHRVPAVVIVEYGDTRIEVGEEPGGGIDHPFATAFFRDVEVPLEREVHRIVWQKRHGQLEPLPGESIIVARPGCDLPIHHQRIDVHARSEVIRGSAATTGRAGLVDVEEQLDHRIADRVRAVVEVGDLLAASN